MSVHSTARVVYRDGDSLNIHSSLKDHLHTEITPELAAELFWHMDELMQSRFFNEIAAIADSLPMQLQYLTDCDLLTNDGRAVMRIIGEYSEQS